MYLRRPNGLPEREIWARRENRSRKNGVLGENQESETHLRLLTCVSNDWEPVHLIESDMQTEEDFSKYLRMGTKIEKIPAGKIESFILCSVFLVPRNAKQRRGNCHNPIFTPGIFSGVSTQYEAAWTELVRPDRDPPHQKNINTGLGAHFSEFEEGRPTLTKVDQVWQKFDRADLTQQGPTTSKEPQDGAQSAFPKVWGGLTNFDQLWPSLTRVDQIWPRFDQGVDQNKSWI